MYLSKVIILQICSDELYLVDLKVIQTKYLFYGKILVITKANCHKKSKKEIHNQLQLR